MKTINIADFKTNLSKYLRLVRRGEHLVVRDRNQPIAEVIPLRRTEDPWTRLAQEKGVRLGTQRKTAFVASKTRRRVDWEEDLRWVQGDE